MQQKVQMNRTMLIDGPASVELVSGKAEVFASPLQRAERVLVRDGKRMPFYVSENAEFNVFLGANAAIAEVEGNSVPESWCKPVQTALELQKKPVVIIVLGAVDSGKSSFITYLLNRFVAHQRRVAVLDGDLGQSDIGPAASVGLGLATKPVSDIRNLKMRNGFFVGVTSPSLAAKKAVKGLASMKNEAENRESDYILVNTDGYVAGADAVSYKLEIIKELKPDIVVAVQVQTELEPILSCLGGGGVMTVEPSPAACIRSPEKRRTIRERNYAKHIKNGKLHCIPISQVTLEPRNGVPKTMAAQKGILMGLYGAGNKFLGIGVLRAVNVTRRTLKIQTSVGTKPMRLVFGKVLLNTKLQEVEAQT